jgi:hypothetical protein
MTHYNCDSERHVRYFVQHEGGFYLKKLWVVLVAFMMIFILSGVVMAEGNAGSVYFDLAVSGSSKDSIDANGPIPLSPKEYNLDFSGKSGYTIGGDYLFGSFKAVLEYSRDSFENTKFTNGAFLTGASKSKLDYTAGVTLAKVGYRVIHNDQFSLDLMTGYLGLSVSGIGYNNGHMNYTNDGPMAALDFSWNSKKLELSGTYGTTIGATPSMKMLDNDLPGMFGDTVADKSSTLTAYRIKVLYMFWDNVGLSFSYAGVKSSLEYKYSSGEKVNDDADYSGIALGVTYKF